LALGKFYEDILNRYNESVEKYDVLKNTAQEATGIANYEHKRNMLNSLWAIVDTVS